jgi:phytoene synthase
MQALYAFLRLSDDLVDAPKSDLAATCNMSTSAMVQTDRVLAQRDSLAVTLHTLTQWRRDLQRALFGQPTHPVHPALVDAVRRFGIQPAWLYAVLDGVAQDVGSVRMQTFQQLYAYCWRVAVAVGLACLAVWGLRRGVTWQQAEPFAEAAGIAIQLTNILRDLGEDLQRDRVYLPAEELHSFGCPVERWFHSSCQPALAQLLLWQVARARSYYRMAAPLADLLSPRARTTFCLITGLYQQLLEQVAAAGPQVLVRRIRLTPWCRWSWLLRLLMTPRYS